MCFLIKCLIIVLDVVEVRFPVLYCLLSARNSNFPHSQFALVSNTIIHKKKKIGDPLSKSDSLKKHSGWDISSSRQESVFGRSGFLPEPWQTLIEPQWIPGRAMTDFLMRRGSYIQTRKNSKTRYKLLQFFFNLTKTGVPKCCKYAVC